MKKIKILSFALLMLTILSIGKQVIHAQDTIKITREGSIITYDGNTVRKGEDYSPHLPVKHYDGPSTNEHNNVYCISGLDVNQPGEGDTCSLITGWGTSYQNGIGYAKYGVAKIIELIHGSGNYADENYAQYYWTELIIQEYLNKFNHSSYENINTFVTSNKIVSKSGKTYLQILQAAREYSDSAIEDVTLTSNQATKELTFTEAKDGYYYSEPVTIQTNGKLEFAEITNKKFKIEEQKNGTYVFKIAAGDISIGSREGFSINAIAKKTISYVKAYNCGMDLQEVVTGRTYNETKSSQPITFRGGVTKSDATIGIAKVDKNGNYVEGAGLLFQTEVEKNNKIYGLKLTSTKDKLFLQGLLPGKYYLSELETPEGYNRFDGYIEIIIDDQGKIFVDGKETNYANIKLVNSKTETKFSKISIVNQKELPGATLTILDENQEVIVDENGNAMYEWISGEEPHYIYGLPVGKYYLKEVKAPEGYSLSEEIVAFEVKGDGSVTEVVMENALEVKVPDTLSSKSVLLLFIGMFDVALGIGILLYVKKNKVTE